ncbi:MAG: hypothetical protein U9Q30_04970 [Campylobacterota bacterium]|nr:hypothetical protein [Campylobacterota bacterium]
MGLKLYISGAVALVVGIFGYVFNMDQSEFTLHVMDKDFVFPIALWVVAPAIALFVVTVLHLLFYGFKNYLSSKAVSRDTDAIITLISDKLLGKNSNLHLKNEKLSELADIIEQLSISVKDNHFSTTNKSVNKIVNKIAMINDGLYVPAKELKLSNSNPIMIKNLINRVSSDEEFALDVLKSHSDYNKSIVKEAFKKIIADKSMTTIKKYLENVEIDKETLILLLTKDSEVSDEFSLTGETIVNLIKKVELSVDELTNIAKLYKKSSSPEKLIKLYEDISELNDNYVSAYLYVLAEYEMTDKIRDILSMSESSQYTSYKALIDLKDSGKNTYSLDTISYK